MKDSPVSVAFRNLVGDDEGVTLVEYGILLACIALLCIGALAGMGQNVSTTYSHAIDYLPNAN